MKLLTPGTEIDGFVIHECLHAGGMAHIYRVTHADDAREPGFPLVMKIPRMASGDGAENIVSFEVELLIHPALSGPHVPRYVAAGDLMRLPYIVMEYIRGTTLQQWMENHPRAGIDEIALIGNAMALAAHSLHQQNVCHLDLKPANVLLKDDSTAVLLDFGLSCHAHYPDLLAEEMRNAVGSPAWSAIHPQRIWPSTCPIPNMCRSPTAANAARGPAQARSSSAGSRRRACSTSPAPCPRSRSRRCRS